MSRAKSIGAEEGGGSWLASSALQLSTEASQQSSTKRLRTWASALQRLGIKPALGRGDAHWLAAQVLLVVARRAVNGVSFWHTGGG